MPRAQTEELQLIEAIVACHPSGLGISAIEAEMARRQGAKPNRRTLQRRLHKLIDERRLTAKGESIALVYRVATGSQTIELAGGLGSSSVVGSHLAELYVPISPEGAAIRGQVRMPLMHRRPVGYQREFLEDYQPGTTFYSISNSIVN